MSDEEILLMLRRSKMWPNAASCLSLNKVGVLKFMIEVKEPKKIDVDNILKALGGNQ